MRLKAPRNRSSGSPTGGNTGVHPAVRSSTPGPLCVLANTGGGGLSACRLARQRVQDQADGCGRRPRFGFGRRGFVPRAAPRGLPPPPRVGDPRDSHLVRGVLFRNAIDASLERCFVIRCYPHRLGRTPSAQQDDVSHRIIGPTSSSTILLASHLFYRSFCLAGASTGVSW